MYLHFKTLETENELLMDGGNLGPERTLYYRELIASYGHHLALNWNLGEEIDSASTAQKQAWSQYFYDNDPYHHLQVVHNGANHLELRECFKANRILKADDPDSIFGDTLNYLYRSVTKAGHGWWRLTSKTVQTTGSSRTRRSFFTIPFAGKRSGRMCSREAQAVSFISVTAIRTAT